MVVIVSQRTWSPCLCRIIFRIASYFFIFCDSWADLLVRKVLHAQGFVYTRLFVYRGRSSCPYPGHIQLAAYFKQTQFANHKGVYPDNPVTLMEGLSAILCLTCPPPSLIWCFLSVSGDGSGGRCRKRLSFVSFPNPSWFLGVQWWQADL